MRKAATPSAKPLRSPDAPTIDSLDEPRCGDRARPEENPRSEAETQTTGLDQPPEEHARGQKGCGQRCDPEPAAPLLHLRGVVGVECEPARWHGLLFVEAAQTADTRYVWAHPSADAEYAIVRVWTESRAPRESLRMLGRTWSGGNQGRNPTGPKTSRGWWS